MNLHGPSLLSPELDSALGTRDLPIDLPIDPPIDPPIDDTSAFAQPPLELQSVNVVPVLRPAPRGLDLEQRLHAREQELQAALAEVAEARRGRETLLADYRVLESRCASLETSLLSAVERVAAAEAAAADSSPTVRLLREELRMQRQRVVDLESDLRAAESQAHRLEALMRQPQSPARPESGDIDVLPVTQARPAAAGPATTGAAPAVDVATRYLLLLEGDTETLFTLRLRTSIGREPDNDIQVDSRFISRHHALIHVGAHHTVIEDLGSTNGVAVNGQRVVRRALSDGDLVVIGKSKFRFLERSPRPDFI